MHRYGIGTSRPKRRAIAWVAIGVGTTLGALLLAGSRDTASAQGQPPPTLVGLTVASHLAAVAAEQPGTIVDMPARDGTRIARGDVLFCLGHRLQELEVKRLQALVGSDLDRTRATASLEHARTKVDRVRELSSKQISAQSSLQEVELESELARLAMLGAEFEREQLAIELQQAEERLAQRTLRSPLDGVVTRRFKQLGETAEELVPVIEVMALDPLWVEFECPVAAEKEFRLGRQVRVRAAAGTSGNRLAEVVHVSLRATPASHSFLVRAAMPNPDYSWRSGLKVYVEAVAAPAAAPPSGK